MKLETAQHIQAQDRVATLVAQKWGYTWNRLGGYSPYDVSFLNGIEIKAIAEIRTKRVEMRERAVEMVDLDKWMSLFLVAIGMPQVEPHYIVACLDGIWHVPIRMLPVDAFRIKYRGRHDRPQAPNDASTVIQVPTGYFRLICDSNGVFENAALQKDQLQDLERREISPPF